MTDKRLGLATYHNASLSSSEKLRNLVFLPFLGCKGISHPNYSCVAGSVGYNMLYRMMRLDSIDWRNVQARFNKHLRKYLESHTEKEKDGVVCLVADDTDIAKSGRKMEHIGRVCSHTEHRHILGFKDLVLGRNDGKTFIPLDFSLHAENGKEGNQGLSSKDRKARLSTAPGEGTPASVRRKECFGNKKSMQCAGVLKFATRNASNICTSKGTRLGISIRKLHRSQYVACSTHFCPW